jgi:streptomycin 6-kinase
VTEPVGPGQRRVELPATFAAYADRSPEMADFLARLPALVHDVLASWDLSVTGSPTHGFCALVVPVLGPTGEPAVLKVGFPHEEAEHEHLALQHWHGRGAVRLLRADPRRSAMLLERLHTRDLSDLWDVDACEVVARLYAQLHVPAPPQLRRLSSYAARWAAGLAALPRGAPLPRRLVEQAASLAEGFAGDPATDGTMLHSDLHYANVLAADRSDWLAIDPKPISGDPHHELAPMLWNRWEELAGDVRAGVRRRFHTLVDAAELDEDRARDWVVLRMMVNARERLADPPGTRRVTATDDYLTTCVTVAKAVQD